MRTAPPGYSVAETLRTGTPGAVRMALLAARARTLALFDTWAAALGPALAVPYRPDLNPILWELGHVAWFQEYWIGRNREREAGLACPPEHCRAPSWLEEADRWYDSTRVPHDVRWKLPLPDPGGTRAYLAATLEQTLHALDGLPPDAPAASLYFFRLAAAHEHMHGEAGIYMSRTLGIALPDPEEAAHDAAPRAALQVPAQAFRIGTREGGFAFDNEQGAHAVRLDAFEIDARPVSAAEFTRFADGGGYRERIWWSKEGWEWLQGENGAPGLATAGGRAGPALHLSAHEAEAWCRWAGRRLPTEAEWECAAVTAPGFRWGQAWEWTASPFAPYPGFVAHPYREYSAPWFHSRRVLRGASAATSPWLAHPRYRNFYEPGRRDIFAGFRSCAAAPASIRL